MTSLSPFIFPGRRSTEHMQSPAKAFDEVARATGIRVTPHDLRRSFVGLGRDARVPANHLKHLVGHRSTDITDSYDIPTDDELRASAEAVHRLLAERCQSNRP